MFNGRCLPGLGAAEGEAYLLKMNGVVLDGIGVIKRRAPIEASAFSHRECIRGLKLTEF